MPDEEAVAVVVDGVEVVEVHGREDGRGGCCHGEPEVRNRIRVLFSRARLAMELTVSQLPGSNTSPLVNTLVNQPKCSQALMFVPPPPLPPDASLLSAVVAVAASVAPVSASGRPTTASRKACGRRLAHRCTPRKTTRRGWYRLCSSLL